MSFSNNWNRRHVHLGCVSHCFSFWKYWFEVILGFGTCFFCACSRGSRVLSPLEEWLRQEAGGCVFLLSFRTAVLGDLLCGVRSGGAVREFDLDLVSSVWALCGCCCLLEQCLREVHFPWSCAAFAIASTVNSSCHFISCCVWGWGQGHPAVLREYSRELCSQNSTIVFRVVWNTGYRT